MAFLEIKTNKSIYYMECANVFITNERIELNNGEMKFIRIKLIDKTFERVTYDEYEKVGARYESLKYIKKENGDFLYKK